MGLPVNDPRMLDLIQNEELLMYQYYWLQKIEHDRYNRLGKMLGTYWEYSDVYPPTTKFESEAPTDKCVYPLSLAINPKILESLKKSLKPPLDNPDSSKRDVELSNMGSHDFRNMVRNYVANIETEVISTVSEKEEEK